MSERYERTLRTVMTVTNDHRRPQGGEEKILAQGCGVQIHP